MKSRSLMIVIAVSVVIAFGLVSCQTKRAVTQPDAGLQQQKDMKPGEQKEKEKVTEKKIDGTVESVDSKDKGAQYTESKENLFSDILFDYDKYDVKETYKPTLQAVSSWLSKNATARLSLEGHCDERGTNEYNLALGDRRAKAVRDYLISLGVAATRVDVISYGEEKPACKEQSDDCWAKNRRVHFSVLTRVGK